MNRYSDLSPLLAPASEANAHALPAPIYTDPEVLKLEHQAIFEANWQLVGHRSQLQKTGDQMVAQIGRVPIVVVCNKDNELKAFHNVCRHRAGPVASENGNRSVLRCQYHGWTYTLDGELRSAPEMQSTPDFEVCQHHLPEAKVCTWEDFVFVCLSDTPPPIDEVLEGIVDEIKPIDLTQMAFSHRDEYIIDCNWKVYMDNYLEGYHLPHVHPGLNKILDYRRYETRLEKWYSYQFSPLGDQGGDEESPNANFYGEGQAHYYCIYPNLMLNILPGRLQTNIISPVDVNKTKVIFDYYYSDIESEATQKLLQQDRGFSDEVQDEDITICEKVQLGLNSGSYHAGRLCMKRETGVLHFQNLVRQSLLNIIKAK